MREGTDRSLPGYDNGTRHPCPFCDWFLDAEGILEYLDENSGAPFMDAVSQRLDEISHRVREHLTTEHPHEYRESTPLRVDITG